MLEDLFARFVIVARNSTSNHIIASTVTKKVSLV